MVNQTRQRCRRLQRAALPHILFLHLLPSIFCQDTLLLSLFCQDRLLLGFAIHRRDQRWVLLRKMTSHCAFLRACKLRSVGNTMVCQDRLRTNTHHKRLENPAGSVFSHRGECLRLLLRLLGSACGGVQPVTTKTEQNRTEQNRTEQNRSPPN